MKIELEMKLAEKYPFMRGQRTFEEQENTGWIDDLYGAFGCECSDGWFDLLDGLCGEVAAVYDKAGVPVDIIVDQIKEKFGTLRFYYHFASPKEKPFRRQIKDIVDKWEERSEETCENCGKPGTLRTDRYWIQTLCDECSNK